MAWLNKIETRLEAGLICGADAPMIVWGDDEAGFVHDVINLMTPEIVLATVCLPPGAFYRYSKEKNTLYDGYACFYVLSGEYTLHACDTGEVLIARAGEVIVLKGPQWHFGYNFASKQVRVLEIIAPPPSTENHRLTTAPGSPQSGVVHDALADFPATAAHGTRKLFHLRPDDAVTAITGTRRPFRLRVFSSREEMSLAAFDQLPGKRSETLRFSCAVAVFCTAGEVYVRNLDDTDWACLKAGDAYYLPAGRPFEIYNWGDVLSAGLIALAGHLGREFDRADPNTSFQQHLTGRLVHGTS